MVGIFFFISRYTQCYTDFGEFASLQIYIYLYTHHTSAQPHLSQMPGVVAERRAIVLDSGTGNVKIGYAGSNFPTAVFPTVLGRPVLRAGKQQQQQALRLAAATAARSSPASSPNASTEKMPGAIQSSKGSTNGFGQEDSREGGELKDLMLGDETLGVRHLLECTMPVSMGMVQKDAWNDMKLLWNYAFTNKLGLDTDDLSSHSLSLSEAPMGGDPHRAKVFEVMFEHFGFCRIQSVMQGILSLYSAGITTGIAVDCGEGIAHCTPVFESYSLEKANKHLDLGGRDVTNFLIRLMQRRGFSFNTSADFETIRRVKEMFCYCAVDFKKESQMAKETAFLEKSMLLPDGSKCTIGAERFQGPEAIFQPHLMGKEGEGLSTMFWNPIQACDMDVRNQLYANVVLSGGSTMLPGFSSRLEKDLTDLFVQKGLKGDRSKLTKGRFSLKINDAPRRKNMVFLGGSCYAELTADSADSWLTKAQYEEEGVSVVHRLFGGTAY